MILSGHSDATYLNVRKYLSQSGAHILLSENSPNSNINGLVLTIAQIVKIFMSSSSQEELAGLFICDKEMVPLRQTVMKMVWPQPKTPTKYKNSTAIVVSNKTIIPCKTKSRDIQFHWIHFWSSQDQFRYFWAPGTPDLSNYSIKNNPPQYQISIRPMHAR